MAKPNLVPHLDNSLGSTGFIYMDFCGFESPAMSSLPWIWDPCLFCLG